MKLKHTYLLLIFVTLVGVALRFYNLGYNSLWLDETATLWYASSGYEGVWTYVLSGEYNPPLFYWLTTFMLNFGSSEFVLRFLPCVFGVIAIPVTYMLGTEWRNETVGLVGASLVALSPYHVYFSMEARAYSLVVVWCLLLLWAYIKANKTKQYKWWLLVAAFAALAFWTHFYSFLLTAALFVYSLIDAGFVKDKLKYPLVGGVAFVWFTLPITLATYYLFKMRTSELPTFGIQGINIIPDLFWNFGTYSTHFSVIFFILFAAGIYLLYKNDKPKAKFAVFVFAFILTITVFASYRIPMVSRYLLYLLPFYMLIISEPFLLLKDKRVQAVAVCGLLVLGAAPLYQIETVYSKNDWRGLADYLTHKTQDGDHVLTAPAYMDLPLKYYYNNTTDNTLMFPASNVTEIDWYTKPGHTWIVMTPDIGAVLSAREIPAYLQQHNATLVTQWQYYISLIHL